MCGLEAEGALEVVYNPLSNISLAHRVRTAVAPGPHLGTGTETCFHPSLKLRVTGGVIGKSWEGALGSFEYFSVFSAGCVKLLEFLRSAGGVVIDDVKVRVGGRAH